MSVKAFELIPTLDRGKLLQNQRSQVTSIECCGKNLYVGTDDCMIVHCTCEEIPSQNGRTAYRFQRQGVKAFQYKKPIQQLKAASALNRILMLCDHNVMLINMLDLEPVYGAGRVKGVTFFCLNDNPVKSDPFSVEICAISKKKGVQIFSISEDRVSLIKDVSTPEPPFSLSVDGKYVCVATMFEYRIINYESGATQELFPYDFDQLSPIITRISREEFLLSAPGALGMFATTTGISQRPPLQWNNGIVAVTYTHPYILALNDEFITVHSILDQQQKQSIPFTGGRYLGEFDGKLFVTRDRDIYALVPVPVEKQIQALLTDKRVKEALELARNATKIGLRKDKFQKMYERIQQQAAFIELSELQFDDASSLFIAGKLDPRELIVLFPGLLSSNSAFMKSVPPLHEIADIVMLTKGDADKLLHFKQFLVAYLEQVKTANNSKHCLMEIDTALLKLYAEFSSPNLLLLIASPHQHIGVSDVEATLRKYHQYHALALLYKCHGEYDSALRVWTEIVDGKTHDPTFPGLEFVVEFLANLSNTELVWKYSEWALSKDQELAVGIFTERPENEAGSEELVPEVVVDFLAKFPKAAASYLEYVVFTKKNQKEKFHTHLAVLYLDNVLQLMKSSAVPNSDLDLARSKLRHLLQASNLYRIQLILSKIKDSDMHAELAILYGKLEEHDKALRLLVHQLRDFGAAENYCFLNSAGKESQHRKQLFQTLLSIYLDPVNTEQKRDFFVAPAVALLNNNKAQFDTLKVLQMLPENWSVGLLSHFLCNSVRRSLHGSRATRVERMLQRTENLRAKVEVARMAQAGVQLAEDRKCAVCREIFVEASCVRYPNGVITHTGCSSNRYVCPVTGKLFRTLSKSDGSSDEKRTLQSSSKLGKT